MNCHFNCCPNQETKPHKGLVEPPQTNFTERLLVVGSNAALRKCSTLFAVTDRLSLRFGGCR